MNNNTLNVMFSSKNETWETPIDLYNRLDQEYKFNLDACALDETTKNENYYTPEIDALTQEWRGSVYMNPPYGRDIGVWLRKAYEESLKGSTVVALIPARTDTKYWHDYVMNANEVRLVKGRLKFGGAENSAPFPSAIVEFRNHNKLYPDFTTYDTNNELSIQDRSQESYEYGKISPIRFIY